MRQGLLLQQFFSRSSHLKLFYKSLLLLAILIMLQVKFSLLNIENLCYGMQFLGIDSWESNSKNKI